MITWAEGMWYRNVSAIEGVWYRGWVSVPGEGGCLPGGCLPGDVDSGGRGCTLTLDRPCLGMATAAVCTHPTGMHTY